MGVARGADRQSTSRPDARPSQRVKGGKQHSGEEHSRRRLPCKQERGRQNSKAGNRSAEARRNKESIGSKERDAKERNCDQEDDGNQEDGESQDECACTTQCQEIGVEPAVTKLGSALLRS